MIRFLPHLLPAACLSIFALTACCPTGSRILGDPRDPYPLQAPPKVGEFVHLPTGTRVTLQELLSTAADSRIVYVGETHDNVASHRLELSLLKGLNELHPGRQALGMEMFSRSQQAALDRWVAGKLDEKSFLKESRWYDNWSFDFAYYRDILLYARDHHIPVIALNAEKKLVETVRSKPPIELTAAERQQLPELDMTDQYQRAMAMAFFSGHDHTNLQLDGFLRAQTLWDETMAESAARYLAQPAAKEMHLMVIAGGNHISYGFGIPRRAFRRLPLSYLLVGGREIGASAAKQQVMNVTLPELPMVPYHFLAYLAYEELPTTGLRLGVMLEPATTGHGLVVRKILPGSNAEKGGLHEQDLLLAIDNEALKDNVDLIYALKQKHPGDHVQLDIERDGKKIRVDLLLHAPDAERPHGKE